MYTHEGKGKTMYTHEGKGKTMYTHEGKAVADLEGFLSFH